MYQAGVKKAISCSRLLFLNRHHYNLKLLVLRWSVSAIFCGCMEGAHPNPPRRSEMDDATQDWGGQYRGGGLGRGG